MKLINIFPNYETFKNDVVDKLNLLFPNVEWLNEQNSYMSFKTLYGLLTLYYGDRDIRYDNEQTFINKFTFDLADILPDIYAKQQVFINNELKTYLSSAQNRAIKIQGGTISNRHQNNNSKAANSITPTNIVITNANELDKLPITSANLSDITLIDNINSSNEQTNFKYIDDLIKNLNSDYSLRLKEFMNMIKNHFTFIDTSNIQKECDGLYNGTRFRNGYYVSNVDYLGVENADQIKLTNNNVSKNTNNIDSLKLKMDILNNEISNFAILEGLPNNFLNMNIFHEAVDFWNGLNLRTPINMSNYANLSMDEQSFRFNVIMNYASIPFNIIVSNEDNTVIIKNDDQKMFKFYIQGLETKLDDDTSAATKKYVDQKTEPLNIVIGQEFETGKYFNGKPIKGYYIDKATYQTSKNVTLISGVEIFWDAKLWRERQDTILFSIPPNSNRENQLILKDNKITLWLLDFEGLGGTFTNNCIIYLEYVKLNS